ncbi:hypothetical protein [Corynebacterium alimapuense]|uniref:Bacterial transcription activator effector binding domain-containing protein n=1 Tax=Corynebacterium alimapuense TaxID=1576874 RepID=A0A3M8K7X2_9CORY|nr:hypothetical protein [Corynebacterium alimapuense]RNE49331.1 hypothetical protein C5L39_02895 [Corynebacterium alimapuense]
MTQTRTFTVPAHAFLAERKIIKGADIGAFVGSSLEKTFGSFAAVGEAPSGPPRVYYYSPMAETVDLASGFPIAEELISAVESVLSADSGLAVYRVGETEVLSIRHTGSYDTLKDSWQELSEQLRILGRPTGPVFWEEYVTMPSSEDPSANVTDLYATLL